MSGKIEPIIPGVSVPGPYPWLTIYFAKMNLKIKNPDGSAGGLPALPGHAGAQGVRLGDRHRRHPAQRVQRVRRADNLGPDARPVRLRSEGEDIYSFDLDLAKKLLLEAGKDVGFAPDKPRDMVIIYNAAAPWQGYIATQVAANINKLNVGLKLDVKALSFTEYVNSWRSQLTGFSIHSTFSLTADPNSWLSAFGTGAGFWARTSSYDNPRPTHCSRAVPDTRPEAAGQAHLGDDAAGQRRRDLGLDRRGHRLRAADLQSQRAPVRR